MHGHTKKDAQLAEDHGLMADPEIAPSVANPDSRIAEAARKQDDAPRPPTPSLLDKLDRERADGEGMVAPPSSPEI